MDHQKPRKPGYALSPVYKCWGLWYRELHVRLCTLTIAAFIKWRHKPETHKWFPSKGGFLYRKKDLTKSKQWPGVFSFNSSQATLRTFTYDSDGLAGNPWKAVPRPRLRSLLPHTACRCFQSSQPRMRSHPPGHQMQNCSGTNEVPNFPVRQWVSQSAFYFPLNAGTRSISLF